MKLYIIYSFTFILSAYLSVLFTPIVKRFAERWGILDRPDSRKIHKQPIALLGGLAIYSSFYISLGLMLIIFFDSLHLSPLAWNRAWPNLLGIFIGSTAMVIMGIIDDYKIMKASRKFYIQIAIALLLFAFGVKISFITIPGHGMVHLNPAVSLLITLLWLVGLANAINFLDGLDGLLAGVSFISGTFFFIVCLAKGHLLVALIAAALCGSCLGFLKYNFYPAKIFMGDTGSLFLGLLLGSVSIMGALKSTTTFAFLVPIAIMGLPIVDTATAIIRRLAHGRSPFQPDKEHIHHKLVGSGMSQRRAVLIIYGLSALLGLVGLLIMFRMN